VRPRSRERFDRSPLPSRGVTAADGDLTDAASLRRAVDGVEVVYHIAATYREAGQPDAAYRAINVDGTRNLLEAAKAGGVTRVVHCSTGGVHGHIANPPATEDAPFNPGDIYQETKLEAERLAREFGDAQGLDVVVARPIGIYGPGDRRFLTMFRGLARGRFPMLGSGTPFYHLTFIDDLVEGFRLCGTVPAARGRTYILAGPRYTTLEQLVQMVAKELHVAPPRIHLPVWPFWTAGLLCELVCVPLRIEPPIYRRRVDFYTKSRAFDTTRARTELGFAPKIDLEEGITRTANWYRSEGLL
jgi:dihydroflavonol-4-reductase